MVYSTDGGRVKGGLQPHNRKVEPPPKQGPPGASRPPSDGIVRIARDKKGRGGKTATVVIGLPGTDADLDTLLKQLKAKCGTGGTRAGRDLVLQGDLRERLQAELEALGHKVKLAGG